MKVILVTICVLLAIVDGSYGLSCVKCDSAYDPSCHFMQPTNRATECAGGGLPEGVQDECFIHFTEMGITIRGCLSENPHMLEVCESGTGSCTTCSGEQCNIDQTLREACAVCDSTVDPNCASAPSSFVSLCPFHYEYDVGGCYLHKKTDGSVARGCMVTGTNDLITTCRTGTDCKICRGSGCNTKVDFQQCHVCDSEDEAAVFDNSCLTTPANTRTQMCQDYSDSCAQLVIPNGKTVRGCFQELDEGISTFCPSNNCQLCSGINCNRDIFPQDRITCYQCNGTENCHRDMTTIGEQAYPCRNYDYQDQCYTVQEGKFVYRGCMSDRTAEKETCNAAGVECNKCTGQGCNSAPVLSLPAPRCQQCTTSSSNSDCAYHQPSSKATQCNNEVEFGEVEQCYISVQGDVVRRGCTGDHYCDSNNCETCGDDYCNSRNEAKMNCIQCHSLQGNEQDQAKCKNTPEELSSTPCRLDEMYSTGDTGCYSIRLSELFYS
ncbi:hypothetical protein DMENIID0001_133950 [Sergentomyia squamirostris]